MEIPQFILRRVQSIAHARTHAHTHSHERARSHISIYVRIMRECNPFATVNKTVRVAVVVEGLRQGSGKE